MIYDLIANKYGFPMFVIEVSDDYVYAGFCGGPEDDNYEYTDKDFAEGNARPIELTPDMLLANGFTREGNKWTFYKTLYEERGVLVSIENMDLGSEGMACLFALNACGKMCNFRVRYVHELQHILRLMGQAELADNFKIKPTLSK